MVKYVFYVCKSLDLIQSLSSKLLFMCIKQKK
jgi:hypothetical protein